MLLNLRGGVDGITLHQKKLLRREHTIKKKLLNTNKKIFLDSCEFSPLSGFWEGYLLSFIPDFTCYLGLHVEVNDSISKIGGNCFMHFPHFQPVDPDEPDVEITDSIWKLKDIESWKTFVQKQHEEDSIVYTKYIESYGVISGIFEKDSVNFKIDTVFPLEENQHVRLERHFRFYGKCMKWFSFDDLNKPNYFIIGNYIDSALQHFPGYGTFVIYKKK